MNPFRLVLVSIVSLTLVSCITNIHPSRETNPPPAEPFSSFSNFVLEPATVSPDAGEVDPDAVNKIQQNLDEHIRPLLKTWRDNAQAGETSGTLVMTPTIMQLKYVSTGTRFWEGAYAGSSAVVMTLRIVEQGSGKEIADPEFYQRAEAMGAAYSFGATDKDMLARIAEITARYLHENYSQAVGGSTDGSPAGT